MSQIIPYLAPGALTNTQSDVTDLQSLSGVPDNSVNLDTFTGNTVRDNPTIKEAIQDIETEVEDRLPDFVQWRVGTGPGYRFDGVDDSVSTSLSVNGFSAATFVVDFEYQDNGALSPVIFTDAISTSDISLIFGLNGTTKRPRLIIGDGGGALNRTEFVSSVVLEDGKRYVMVVKFDDQFNASLFINGESVSFPKTIIASGGVIPLIGNAITVNSASGSYSRSKITTYRFETLNRAVTDAEAVLLSRGQRLGFADRGATGTYSYFSNRAGGFDTSVDGWVNNIGLSSLAIEDGVSDGSTSYDDVLALPSDAGTTIHSALKTVSPTTGKRHRLSGKYFVPSGNTASRGFQITTSGTVQNLLVGTQVGTWTNFEVEFIWTTGTAMILYHLNASAQSTFTGVAGEKVYCRDLQLTPIGEVLSLLPEGAAPAVWADQSGNGYNGTVTGATLINPMPLHADAFVSLTNLPTSSAGLATGQVWNDSGTLKIV